MMDFVSMKSYRYTLGTYPSGRWMGDIFLKDIEEYIFSPYIPLSTRANLYAVVNSR